MPVSVLQIFWKKAEMIALVSYTLIISEDEITLGFIAINEWFDADCLYFSSKRIKCEN